MHPALDQTTPLHGITWAPGTVAAAAITTVAAVVTGDHVIPEEVVPVADTAGVTPGGGPIPMTHCDHTPLNDATISHNPVKGIDPVKGIESTIKVGLDPREVPQSSIPFSRSQTFLACFKVL